MILFESVKEKNFHKLDYRKNTNASLYNQSVFLNGEAFNLSRFHRYKFIREDKMDLL